MLPLMELLSAALMTATILKGLFAGEELRNSFVEHFSFSLNSLDSLDGKRQWLGLVTYSLTA